MLAASLPAAPALAGCQLKQVGEFKVTMRGSRPLVHVSINGHDMLFLADSGAFYSFITMGTVKDFQLHLEPTSNAFYTSGVGGDDHPDLVRIDSFAMLGATLPNVKHFLVVHIDLGEDVAGVLGQEILRFADIEYDLANNAIRLMQPDGCKGKPLAYWAGTKPYSEMEIHSSDVHQPHTTGSALLNGAKIRVMFDTGASASMLTLAAAKQAGVTPTSPGIEAGGSVHGIGRRVEQSWLARFPSFKIGDEEIHNARLRFGDIELQDTDMLLGADFFLSHRVYVSTSQGKLYFTYNGGPVFDLRTQPGGSDEASSGDTEPAAGYALHGREALAKKDYPQALADFDRACTLAPTNAQYFYDRGFAHFYSEQPDLALADYSEALRLDPGMVAALDARAALRLDRKESPQLIAADLDAADRTAAPNSGIRLRLGPLYEAIGNLPAALAQYTKWIDSHERGDPKMSQALNGRCWVSALAGSELDQALKDCDAALKLKPGEAAFLDSRGLLHLRRGEYDLAIADYDEALRLNPKLAWSLYGRGLARLHKGDTGGNADIAAAQALDPELPAKAKGYGFTS